MLRKMNLVACIAATVSLALSASSLKAGFLLRPSDSINAVWNTVAGGNSTTSTEGTGVGQWMSGTGPANAIDGNTATKYLNFGKLGAGESSADQGVGTGFYITPSRGASILTQFQMATADDVPDRDPLSITIEGSNATGTGLTLGSNWTSLYSGSSGLVTDPGRASWGEVLSIANSNPYTSYRLLITSQAGVANCMQYGEVAFMGSVVPEPSTVTLLVAGLLGLLAYAWRKQK